MEYHSYRDWGYLGYLIKAGARPIKRINENGKIEYLYNRKQVFKDPLFKLGKGLDKSDNLEITMRKKFPKTIEILKNDFDIFIKNKNDTYKSYAEIFEELANKFRNN